MAERAVTESLLDDLGRDAVHEADMARALRQLKSRLDAEGVPFVIIGALAMRRHGYSRFTDDIDILTSPAGLNLIHERLLGRGYLARAPGWRKKLRDTANLVDIDVLQSGEHAGSEASPILYPDPTATEAILVDAEGFAYPTLVALLSYKLASGRWGKRPRDLADAQELVKANALDESFASRLPEPLRAAVVERVRAASIERDIE